MEARILEFHYSFLKGIHLCPQYPVAMFVFSLALHLLLCSCSDKLGYTFSHHLSKLRNPNDLSPLLQKT